MEEITLTCNLCQKSYPIETYDQHLSSEIHLKYAKISSTYYCEICKSPASGEIPFLHHIRGKQHEKTKNKSLQPSNWLNTGDRYMFSNSPLPKVVCTKDGPYFVCECNTMCNSMLDLEKHRMGPICRRKMQRKDLWHYNPHSTSSEEINNVGAELMPCDISTYCDICKTVIPEGYENKKVHENGQKHKKKKEQIETKPFISSHFLGTYPEQHMLIRRNSQESELSETMSSLSFVTAPSELGSIAQEEPIFPQITNSPPEAPAEMIPSGTRTSSTANELVSATQNVIEKSVDVKKPEHKRGRGYCLIINQTNFPDSQRHGSNIDASLLKQTFEKLNFEVRMEVDLTAQDMLYTLQEICYFLNRHPKKYYLMCICFLSHGNKDVEKRHELIYGVDNGEIHIRDQIVFDIFNSKNCPSMSKKPKLFISNACRGYQELPGIEVISYYI